MAWDSSLTSDNTDLFPYKLQIGFAKLTHIYEEMQPITLPGFNKLVSHSFLYLSDFYDDKTK